MQEEELQNPFVVQCAACRRVLSDSFSLMTVKAGHLVHTHSTLARPDAGAEGAPPFADSIAAPLVCGCGSRVGTYLVSASQEWNGCAGGYAIDKSRITSYQLGNVTNREKTMGELVEDVEKIKCVVAKIYKKVFQ